MNIFIFIIIKLYFFFNDFFNYNNLYLNYFYWDGNKFGSINWYRRNSKFEFIQLLLLKAILLLWQVTSAGFMGVNRGTCPAVLIE